MNTRTRLSIVAIVVALALTSIMVSARTSTVDIVGMLEERALNTVVEGDSHVDPGDYTLQLGDMVIGLWKRIYGYGYVNVTSNGVLVKAAFSKASMGMAGIYVKFTNRVVSFNTSLALKIIEDYGGAVELILHKSWYNGTGGDKPGSPLAQVIIYPKYGLALVGKAQKNIGKTSVLKINVSYRNNTSILTVNGVTGKISLDAPPTYVTLMALSTDPGLNITFLIEYFNITYTTVQYNTVTSTSLPPSALSNTSTTSTSPHTCTKSTPEIETVSFATNASTPTKPVETEKPTGMIVSNATITIVYPNGTTQTSIVPVTRKPVSGEHVASMLETNTSMNEFTSSVEGRVFDITFYMILLVAIIVVAVASLVFSRKTR